MNEPFPPISKRPSFRCLHELLALQSELAPDAVAIGAPDLLPLTHGGLRRNVAYTVPTLNDVSVSRNGCVATMLPNRSEMATLVRDMALGAPATALYSALGQSKLNFSLSELGDHPHNDIAYPEVPSIGEHYASQPSETWSSLRSLRSKATTHPWHHRFIELFDLGRSCDLGARVTIACCPTTISTGHHRKQPKEAPC